VKYYHRIGTKAEICFDVPFETDEDPEPARLNHAVRQLLEKSIDGFDVPVLAGARCYPDFRILEISEDDLPPAMTDDLEDYGLVGCAP
jgi:hypothetical protein